MIKKVQCRDFYFSLLFLLGSFSFYGQTAGIDTTFLILSLNGGGNTYYDLQASTTYTDFEGANLGSFMQGSSELVFKGAEHNVWKCGGCDITATYLYYRIYPAGSPSGSFVQNHIGWQSQTSNSCGGLNQKWATSGYNTNLIGSLTPGNYVLEVYSTQSTSCSGTQSANNGGNNYKANFTIQAQNPAGFDTTYLVLSVNGGSNTYYDLKASTSYPDFNGTNLGTFGLGSSGIVFKGAEHNVWKCSGCDISGSKLLYRIYPTGSPTGGYVENNMNWSSESNNSCGGKNQRWSSVSFNTNLTGSLSAGNYTLEVYSSLTSTCLGVINADNSGNFYKATFTISNTPTPPQAGFDSTFVVLNINGTGNTYFDMLADTSNTDFDGANLGTFCQGVSNGIIFKGAEHNVWKCSGCDITGSRVYYRVYPTGSPSGSFSQLNTGWSSQSNNSCGGQNQKWQIVSSNNNLTSGLSPGNYTLEVYSTQATSCLSTLFDNNGGANYKATFTINANVTYYADVDQDGFGNPSVSQVSCMGPQPGYVANNSDCNDAVTHYQDNDGDGFGSDVKIPCGSVTNSLDSDDNLITYADLDEDGHGSAVLAPFGATNNTDCDDSDQTIWQTGSFYIDADGDGYDNGTGEVCYGSTAPEGYSETSQGTDCDDTNEDFYQIGDLYVDADNDGYTSGATAEACYGATAPSGFVLALTAIDCNDEVAAVNPGAAEVAYNGIDDNCNGTIDEGSQVFSQVQALQCGTTLVNIGSLVAAISRPAATGYRFEVTNTETNDVQTIDRGVPNFSFTQLDVYDYATTYSIRVMVQRNGVWLNYYGDSCLVSTPAITSPEGAGQVNPSQCGALLPSINTLIATTSLPGVAQYRFRVTDLTDGDGPNMVQTIDRPLHWFSLKMLTRYNYGTTYSIEVAVRTTGSATFSGYGAACTVTTPAVPSLTPCGGVVATSGTNVNTVSLNSVTSYRFVLTNFNTLEVTTIDRPLHWFRFSMVPDYVPGDVYGVQVAVMTSGEWSPFSDGCEITAPAAARGSVKEEAIAFNAVAYPNPFADTFGIEVTTSAETNINVKVYDMTGRMLEQNDVPVTDMQTLQVGERYPAGVYNVIVTQGDEVKSLRVIKR